MDGQRYRFVLVTNYVNDIHKYEYMNFTVATLLAVPVHSLVRTEASTGHAQPT